MRFPTRASAGLLAGLLLAPAGANAVETQKVQPVSASQADKTGTLKFKVERDGSVIGTHRVEFRRNGDKLTVEVKVDLEVGIGPISLFTYTHSNSTTWKNGRLARIDSKTDDNGDKFFVEARRTDDGQLRVTSPDGTKTVRGDILPSTWWLTATVDAGAVLNTQKGTVTDLSVVHRGEDRKPVPGGGRIQAEQFRVKADIETDVWYDYNGRWVGLGFDAKGSRINYELVERSGYVPTRPPNGPVAQNWPGRS
jgi:hypothetical protein